MINTYKSVADIVMSRKKHETAYLINGCKFNTCVA